MTVLSNCIALFDSIYGYSYEIYDEVSTTHKDTIDGDSSTTTKGLLYSFREAGKRLKKLHQLFTMTVRFSELNKPAVQFDSIKTIIGKFNEVCM